jgi:predicted SprT family Zn-dependent metalloprotease
MNEPAKNYYILVVFFVIAIAFVVTPKLTYNENNPVLNEIKRRFAIISPKYGNIPIKTGNHSYTQNKSQITLCITDPKTKKYYNIDVLMYVALHELAHCITAEGKDSHGTEFKNNFTKLLKKSSALGVYNPNVEIPNSYCGIK